MDLAHGHQEPLEGIDFAIASKDEIAAFLASGYQEDADCIDGGWFRLANAHLADQGQFASLLKLMPTTLQWYLTESTTATSEAAWSPVEMALELSPTKVYEFVDDAIFELLAPASLTPLPQNTGGFPRAMISVSANEAYQRLCRDLHRLPLAGFTEFSLDFQQVDVNLTELYSALCQANLRAFHVSLRGCNLSWKPSDCHTFEGRACISTRIVSQNPLDPEVFYAFRAALPHISIQLGILPNMLEILRDPRADELLTVMEVYCA